MLDKYESKVTFSVMKYLRKLDGKIRRDKIRKTTFREGENLLSSRGERENIKLKLCGHLIRMNYQSKTKKVFEGWPEGEKKQGRPRKEWEHYIGEKPRDRGIELKTLKKMVQDRD